MLHMDMYTSGTFIAQILGWGPWLFPLGYMGYMSGYFPKVLGILLMVSCFIHMSDALVYFVAPEMHYITSMALGLAAVSSVTGGVFSLIIFLLATPLLAKVALQFRPPEYFALAIFALSMLAAISGKSSIRNLIAGAIGVLIGALVVPATFQVTVCGPDRVSAVSGKVS